MITADGELGSTLANVVDAILGDPERLASMSAACRALARPDAARRVAQLAWEAAG
jgi:UDP-N-acetylglucosamine:LPS N-acetylglucosamine transferase